MKLVHSLVSAACIACLSLSVQGVEAPLVLASAVIEADIVQSDAPGFAPAAPVAEPAATPAPVAEAVVQAAPLVEKLPEAAPAPVTTTATAPIAVSDQAAASAFADGMSTLGVLAAGGVELNPIMPTSPVGILMMTAAKMGMTQWANSLPEEERKSTLRSMNATFGGAAVNNLLVLATAANPIALVGGLVAGIYFWNDTDQRLTAEAEARTKRYQALAAEHHRVTMLAYHQSRQESLASAGAPMEVRPLAALDPVPTMAEMRANDPLTPQVAQKPVDPLQLAQAFVAEQGDAQQAPTAPVAAPAALPAQPVLQKPVEEAPQFPQPIFPMI
ncbi:MAG: hypothetical protein V4562_09395 [Pseudomonadota bacterium]